MADAWRRGERDESVRSPLQGGAPPGDRGAAGDPLDRRDRRLRVGVGHPSDDPARHRAFEVRATYRAAAGGWVAQIREENRNEQLEEGLGGQAVDTVADGPPRAFSTPAECLGDAVAGLVALIEREADDPA